MPGNSQFYRAGARQCGSTHEDIHQFHHSRSCFAIEDGWLNLSAEGTWVIPLRLILNELECVVDQACMSRGNCAERHLGRGGVIHRSEDESVLAFPEPGPRNGNCFFVSGGLRNKRTFPVAGAKIELGMEIKISGMPINIELQKRQTRRLIQDGDLQVIGPARRILQREFYREGVQAPARYPVGRSRLKAIPIFIAALADHEHGITVRIGVVDVLALKFARGAIEGPDSPERFLSGVRRQRGG